MNYLVDYIESNTSLTVGTDLWANMYPTDEALGVALIDAGGSESESGMLKTQIQILSTGVDANTAKSNCETVYNLLAFNNGMSLNSVSINNVIGLSTVKFIHVNNRNYYVYSASVVMFKERN